MTDKKVMQPIIVLPTGKMSKRDMTRLRKNGICVVETDTPSAVRFVEPPLLGYTDQEMAAIQLFRWIMEYGPDTQFSRRHLANKYSDIVSEGLRMQKVAKVKS